MNIVNQQSFTLAAIFLLGLLAFILLHDGPKWRDWLVLGLVTAGIVLLWLTIRPQASHSHSAREVEALIGSGTPVLLEFQSPY